jgi:hypothetical protein
MKKGIIRKWIKSIFKNHSVKSVRTLVFFKQDKKWYADVPGHTLAENRMVAGADTFLEFVDKQKKGKVIITLSASCPNKFMLKLVRIEHDPFGATYKVSGPFADENGISGSVMWLCNVTHDVLGEHPKEIYIHSIV